MGGFPLGRMLSGLSHPPIVYFLRNGGRVKIGTTVRLAHRVKSLSLSLADVVQVFPGGADVEREFHARFGRYRIVENREWFRLTGELRDFLAPDEPETTTDVNPAISGAVGLRDAVNSRVLTVSLDSARAARKRDHGFPAPVGRDGQVILYDPDSLRQWERNRPRAGESTA